MLRVQCSPALLRLTNQLAVTEDVAAPADQVSALVENWMRSCTLQGSLSTKPAHGGKQRKSITAALPSPTAASALAQTDRARAADSASAGSAGDQQHLVLAMPLCLDLVLSNCSTPKLKTAAVTVIK